MNPGGKNKPIPGSLEARLLHVCRLLNKKKAKYVVIGGAACILHGLIRATKDIDLLIPKDERNTRSVLDALGGLTFGISRELDPGVVAHKAFTIIGDTPCVDLLTVANKIRYGEASQDKKRVRVGRVWIPYAGLKTLLATKKTGRLQDLADIERLKQIHKPS